MCFTWNARNNIKSGFASSPTVLQCLSIAPCFKSSSTAVRWITPHYSVHAGLGHSLELLVAMKWLHPEILGKACPWQYCNPLENYKSCWTWCWLALSLSPPCHPMEPISAAAERSVAGGRQLLSWSHLGLFSVPCWRLPFAASQPGQAESWLPEPAPLCPAGARDWCLSFQMLERTTDTFLPNSWIALECVPAKPHKY